MTNYNKYLERLKSKDNNIENYYYKELKGNTESTILNHLISISKLFETNEQRNNSCRSKNKDFNLNHNNVNKLTEQDIKDFIDSEWWNNLSSGTQKMYTNRIKKYLKYSERIDLLNLLPKKFNGKTEELSNIDLITKKDLEQILEYSNLQYQTLFMILYEGALRLNEALNIRKKDVKVESPIITRLRISESKTYGRDIVVLNDTSQKIKEYLRMNDFEPKDKLFDFKYNIYVNNYLNIIKKKLIKKYPKQWKGRKLYPHLFRHSRLTELAKTRMNEAQIKKFAGWTAGSKMAGVYFHLNDEDIINILTDNVVETPKPEPIKPVMCKICNTENAHANIYCWNCKNILNEEDRQKLYVETIIQPDEVKKLREENKNMKDELMAMKQLHTKETDSLRTEIMEKLRAEMKEDINDIYKELGYKKDLNQRVNQGKMTSDEVMAEYQGFEITEEEKHSKVKK